MNKLYLFLLSLTIFLSCTTRNKNPDDPTVEAEANDPELEQAKKDAHGKLDYFINAFLSDSSANTTHAYSIKADFIENDQHEHMWIELTKIEGDKFKGVLGNEPEVITQFKIGDSINISKEQIEDWIIFDNGTEEFEGGYSVKVFQKRGEY